jgi:nucleotide-binding universal stress UspA family protein
MRTNKILIPLDGSETAEAAIAEARQLARPGSSTLLLLRVAESRTMLEADVIGDQVLAVREAEQYLASLKDRLEKEGVRGIETHVWYGPAASAIVEATRVNKVDLIVMTTHGRSGLGRLVFGSVAEAVLRGTTVPIFLVRPTGAPVEAPAGRGEAGPAKRLEPKTRAEALR